MVTVSRLIGVVSLLLSFVPDGAAAPDFNPAVIAQKALPAVVTIIAQDQNGESLRQGSGCPRWLLASRTDCST